MIQKDLLLCHNSVDKDWVRRLGARVEAESWNGRHLSVFLDEWDIEPGENIVLKLSEALEQSRFVALVMTPEMLGSDWCQLEFTSILATDPTNRRGRLIPIRLRDFHKTTAERLRLPPVLAALNYLDFRKTSNFEKSFARLVGKLRGEAPPRGVTQRGRTTQHDGTAEPLVPALPERREEPDAVPETLLSNLLHVQSLPRSIWSAPASLGSKLELPPGPHFPPFILRDGRLWTFFDLSREHHAFTWLVSDSTWKQNAIVDWRGDEVRWRWIIELLNLSLREYLWPEVGFDKTHGRFWFQRHGDASVRLRWGVGVRRTVVRMPDPGSGGYWVHQAARLRFETIGPGLCLSIEPSYVFTTDGATLAPADVTGPLAMMWGGRERNGAILRHVLMWCDVLTRGRRVASIPAGDQEIVISRLPATVEAPVSVVDDHVRMRSLLEFTRAELDLNVPSRPEFGFIHDEAAEEPCDDDDADE